MGLFKQNEFATTKKKGSCLVTALKVYVVFLVIGIVFNIVTSEDSNQADTQVSTQENAQVTVSPSNNVSTNADDKFYPEDVYIGNVVKVSYLECGEYTDYNEYTGPAEGNKILFAKFEFKNLCKDNITVSYLDFNCYADGYSCEGYYDIDDAGLDFLDELSPERKCTGVVAFEVPADATEIEFEYTPNIWPSQTITFVYSE